MDAKVLQQLLFKKIKEQLPEHLSLAESLGELLGLSADSVYRRIRGEKPVDLNELQTICRHYHLSLDGLLQLNADAVLFQAPGVSNGFIPFEKHMQGMLEQFKYFTSFRKKEIFYLCKDTPFWYFFLFPAMASFKTFFWSRTINNAPELQQELFSLESFPAEECRRIGWQLLEEHNKMDSTELWNLESIHSSINQVAYYRDAGIFRERKDLLAVVDDFIRMLDHLQQQAERGITFLPGDSDLKPHGNLQFYVNELILGNNTILLNLDGQQMSMVTYSVFNYISTRDTRFAAKAFGTFNTLLSRSSLISRSGEKERNKFFNTLRDKVNQLKN
jgi:hypothetical protein